MAVRRATRRLNVLSRRSSSSSGSGSSISATRRRGAFSDLLAHGVLARLERAHEPLRLFLEQLTALVEPFAGAPLRLVGQLLRLAGDLAAALREELARLAARLGRQQKSGGGADDAAQEEPAEISGRIVSIVSHVCLLGPWTSVARRRRYLF